MQSRITSNNRPKSSSKFIEQELTAQELAKNSKIINRKQLEKRIQGLNQQQYVKICNNLTSQNKRLKSEVKMLNEKVQELILAKKLSKNVQKNPQIEQQILKQKRQLELKYESMNYLKEQIKKKHKQDSVDDMNVKQKQVDSQLSSVQKQYAQLQKQKKKLSELLRMNEVDMNQYHPMSNNESQARIDAIKLQNKELKHEIGQLQGNLKQQQKDSVVAISKIYDLKRSEQRQFRSIFQSKATKKSQKTLQQIKQGTFTEVSVLQKQIEQLKKRKKQTQKDLVNDRIVRQSKKSKMQKEIRESLEYHKDLFKRRVKALNELNYYERKDKQHHEKLQAKASIEPITYQQASIQTQTFYQKQFRKDWVGNVTGPVFDDGENMEFKSQVQVKCVTVYFNKDYIVFVRFQYQAPGKKKYETEVPFEALILKKCELKKLTARSNGYLINAKISITDKKITKIDFKWSDGETMSQGWDADNSTKYQLDIQGNERPVSFSGSVSYQGKSMYALESLGCEICEMDE